MKAICSVSVIVFYHECNVGHVLARDEIENKNKKTNNVTVGF
jgi:hypothetical protein